MNGLNLDHCVFSVLLVRAWNLKAWWKGEGRGTLLGPEGSGRARECVTGCSGLLR